MYFFILFLLAYFLEDSQAQTSSNFSRTLDFGTSKPCPGCCSQCCCGFEKANHFIFINGTGGVGEYVTYVENFLPEGYLLSKAYLNLTGAFQVGSPTKVTVSVLLNDFGILTDFKIEPVPCQTNPCCACPNCHRTISLPLQNPTGHLWWDHYYNYQGNNVLKFVVTANNISLSKAELTFTGIDVRPDIDSLSPIALPVDSSRSPLFVGGSNFLYYFRFTCQWEDSAGVNHTIPAVYLETSLECLLSPTEHVTPGLARFWLFVNISVAGGSKITVGPFPYLFYEEPVINQLLPASGDPRGGVDLVVSGKNFFNSTCLSCKFADFKSQGVWVNSSTVLCQIPAMKGQSRKVIVSVTENGVDWTNGVPFVYDTTSFRFTAIWITVVSVTCFLIVLSIMGGYVWCRKNALKMSYEPITTDLQKSGYTVEYEDLTFKERIGGGSFGVVYRGLWRFSEIAIKQIPITSNSSLEELATEAKLMGTLRHPNVTQLMGMCVKPPEVCIVTEYIHRGSLFGILHLPPNEISFEWEHIRRFAWDTCKGMAYIHGALIIHRDLKCSNLLVTKDWTIKVSDFGLSRFVSEAGNTMTACGTPSWAAPEVLRNNNYSFKADVYSFSICLWEMLTRKHPYRGQAPYNVVISVGTKGARPELPTGVPKAFVDMMIQCWDEEPNNRPTFGELVLQLSFLKFPKVRHPKMKTTEPKKLSRLNSPAERDPLIQRTPGSSTTLISVTDASIQTPGPHISIDVDDSSDESAANPDSAKAQRDSI